MMAFDDSSYAGHAYDARAAAPLADDGKSALDATIYLPQRRAGSACRHYHDAADGGEAIMGMMTPRRLPRRKTLFDADAASSPRHHIVSAYRVGATTPPPRYAEILSPMRGLRLFLSRAMSM